MTDLLLVLPVVAPLLGAAVSLLLRGNQTLQRAFGVTLLTATTVISAVLLFRVEADGTLVTNLGGWPAGVGITLVADLFSALMLVTAMIMLLAVLVYAIGQPGTDAVSPWFHPVYLTLAAGVAMSLLTGDLFNLFVSFEVMLVSSYVLITLGATANQIRSGMTYVVISLLASMLFITGVALVYAATGTVNLADLSVTLPGLSEDLRLVLALLFIVVFGIKAALFPLFFWLPDSYPTAPTPITAIFAGLLTKVGVYAIIRTQTIVFGDVGQADILLWIAGLTMVVGVLGAIAQSDMKRILSFHIVSQIGYMVFGLALFTVAGIAAAIYFTIHQIVIKTSLFLVGGLVEQDKGTANLKRLGGLVHERGVLAVLFLLSAFSLAGFPPLSGFVGKLGLVEAGFAADRGLIVAVSLFASVLTLFSMTKIWGGVFWGEPEPEVPVEAVEEAEAAKAQEPPSAPETAEVRSLPGPLAPAALAATALAEPEHQAAPSEPRRPLPRLMMGATAASVALGVALALFAGPIYDLTDRAAAELLDPTSYVQTVLDP